jgi:MOSC domain-containing protein YiiM
VSELVSIVYKPKDGTAVAEGYTRVSLPQAQLIAGHGIEGDAKGGGAGRQLNIMTAETMRTLASEGFHTAPGQMGEQLVIAGLAVDSLPRGARIQIGDSACVEIGMPRTGCATFEQHQGKLRQEAARRMGMMAEVLVGGLIRVGDPVRVLDESASREQQDHSR